MPGPAVAVAKAAVKTLIVRTYTYSEISSTALPLWKTNGITTTSRAAISANAMPSSRFE